MPKPKPKPKPTPEQLIDGVSLPWDALQAINSHAQRRGLTLAESLQDIILTSERVEEALEVNSTIETSIVSEADQRVWEQRVRRQTKKNRKAEEKKAQEFAKNSDAIPNYTRTAFFNERRKIDDARLLQRFLAFMKRNQADWSRMRKIMGDWLHSSQLADPDGKRVAYTESADPIMCAGFPRVLLPFDYTWSPIDRVYDSSYPALFNNKLMTWLEIFTHPGGKAWLRLRHLKWLKNWRNLTGGMAKVCYLASIAKFALAERFNLATLTNVDNRYTLFGVAAWWATALDKRQEFDDALRKNMVSADNITTGEACQLAVEMWQVYSSMEQRHGLMQ